LKVAIKQGAGYMLVSLSGTFDAHWAGAVGDRISFSIQEYSQGRPLDVDLIVDLSEVAYISSGAIRVLLELHRRIEGAGRKFAVCNPAPQVSKVMQTSGLYNVFAFYPSVEAAARTLAGFRSPRTP